MLTVKEAEEIKEALLTSKQPLFFFHDDPDGLASYLLCDRFIKEGQGFPIKARPCITKSYLSRVEEVRPDKIFILDVALVEQDFIDAVKVPIIWIDHHNLSETEGTKYYNPQKRGVNIPTPALIWQAVGEEIPKYLWLAVVGTIGDWYLPPFAVPFQQAYPELLPKTCTTVQDALFNAQIGTLVKVFSFNLKGSITDVRKSLKAFKQIEDPYEILDQKTPAGELLWEKYEKTNLQYERIKNKALKHAKDDKIFVYVYPEDKLSVTKELANELLYLLKDKVIILGREKRNEIHCSIRAPEKITLSKAFEKALIGIEGYGGGHEQALGGSIRKENFNQFVENLRKELQL